MAQVMETSASDSMNDENFILFASRHYDNPGCTSVDEFWDDLKKFKYLNRLFQRYENDNADMQERLVLNHLIFIGNVFGVDGGIMMLSYKIRRRYWYIVKPFLLYLDYIHPEQGVFADIVPDPNITAMLERL